ncbi:MAG TPA: cell wall-binding repeat-containing protein, partial [Ruminiclostridium sp.]|nr:cell wall-binding repeat-containing protein [Ruminiclostridium sp.]
MTKKLCLVIIIAFIFSMMYPSISFADSPITSTQFYTAYLDIEIVEKASEMTNIDEKTIKYLSDPEYPLDIKAAVINALGWEIEGKDNAAWYADFIFEKPLGDLDFDAVP